MNDSSFKPELRSFLVKDCFRIPNLKTCLLQISRHTMLRVVIEKCKCSCFELEHFFWLDFDNIARIGINKLLVSLIRRMGSKIRT